MQHLGLEILHTETLTFLGGLLQLYYIVPFSNVKLVQILLPLPGHWKLNESNVHQRTIATLLNVEF